MMSKNTEPRVLLFIDDNPEDRVASRRALTAELPSWEIREADCGEDALLLLEELRPDCVLLDYNLPDMNGLDVLASLGERLREIPVIIVTGHGDEAVAVTALKAGARDYLSKDGHGIWLQLLPRTVERTVGEHQRELDELREREARMRLLLESGGDGICGVDTEGLCTFANRACAEALGYASSQDLFGRHMHTLIHHHRADGSEYPVDECPLAATWRGGEGIHTEDEMFWRRDGSAFPAECTAYPMRDENGTLLGAVISFRDITDRVQREAQLRRLTRTYAVLSGCNHDLVHSTTESELVERFCQTLVQTGGYPLAWIAMWDPGPPGKLRTVASVGAGDNFKRRICRDDVTQGDDIGLAFRAIHESRIVHARDTDGGPCFGECVTLSNECRYHSVAALPLKQDGGVIGVLVLYAAESDAFDEQSIALLAELADDLAFGFVTLRNEEARVQAEAELYLRNEAIQAASNGIMIVAADKIGWPLIYANTAFERITGYRLEEVLGRNPGFLAGAEHGQVGLEAIRSAMYRQEPATALLRNYRKDGSSFWNELNIAPVKDKSGAVTHYVGIVNDVTDRVRYEQQLEYQATYDVLTGLPNRHLLEDRLEQAFLIAERYQRTCALLFLDLDRFKFVNDTLGHHAGDELLKVLAARLAGAGRDGDTVARYGGDEFVVLLPDLAQANDMDHIVERLQAVVADPVHLMGQELLPSFSIGAAFYPRDGKEPETLLRCADIAMFRAKDAGGNCLRLFSEEMGEQLTERMRLERDLRYGLANGEIIPHFQPIVDISTGRLVGMEALARWIRAEGGFVSPAKFIPLAEDTGQIATLGWQILEQVAQQIVSWTQEGLTVPAVSVNLSPHQLALPDFVPSLAELLAQKGIPGEALDLEVTEGALIQNPEQALARLQDLKDLGIKLSLDDFGTGYSSLNYLKRFPFDILKIDQSFVRDIPGDPHDAAITLTIINMSRSLGMKVIAEGVETEQQCGFLLEHACDYAQGWYYSKPVAADDARAIIAAGTLG